MYFYEFIFIYICIHVFECVETYRKSYMSVGTHYIYACMYMYMHTYVHKYMYVHTYILVGIYIYAYICMHIHITCTDISHVYL